MSLLKPWLFLPAKVSHDLSPYLIRAIGIVTPQKKLNPRTKSTHQQSALKDTWRPFTWRKLSFKNRLGTSGGLDKNAVQVQGWWSLGVGFVEVGTVTPEPQEPNPGQILDRDAGKLALWNKMGFPNKGLKNLKANLENLGRPYYTPVFVNIGKNRNTPNETAVDDYLKCIRELRATADVFVVNISSPNTKGLRDLLAPEKLHALLTPLVSECKKSEPRPLLLKLSPDTLDDDFKSALDTSLAAGVDGWILTNTTTAREKTPTFPQEGGVSGQPLAERSKALLKLAIDHLGERKKDRLVVSVGGVLTPQDVFDRLSLGADLVQVYSALVFSGPFFFKKVAKKAKQIF